MWIIGGINNINYGTNYSTSIDNGLTWQAQALFSNLQAGIYPICASLPFGCQTCSTATITNPNSLQLTATNDTVICQNGTATIQALGEGPFSYTYYWQGLSSANSSVEIQSSQAAQVFCNGSLAERVAEGRWKVPQIALEPGELNLIALRWAKVSDPKGDLPTLTQDGHKVSIGPIWEICAGSGTELARLPLPAKFAAATDAISRKGH